MQSSERSSYLLCFSERKALCESCSFNKYVYTFSDNFLKLNKSSKISKIFHNFVLFYRIFNYWNSVNKRVFDDYFELLDVKNIIYVNTFEKFTMGCVSPKQDAKINNMLPKHHEAVSGEITLKKVEDFDIFCFEINFDGFLSTRICLLLINSPCFPPPAPDNESFDIGFYTKKSSKILTQFFVVPFLKHPFFKERVGSQFVNLKCSCANMGRGCCNSCKIVCFNFNFLVDKIKIARYIDVPANIEILPIAQYLADTKSMLFFYFCREYFKVQCSLDSPEYGTFIKSKIQFGFGM